MNAIRTTCPYCGVGCGISAQVNGARTVSIMGDKDHPANRGNLCSKGTHLGETVTLEGRLLHPEMGGEPVSWDRALDEAAGRMQACIEDHGPDSVAFYVSGQLLTEDYYVANKLMKGFIGSGNIDTNSRLCMASAVAAQNRAFGEDVVPCSYEDLDSADLIVLIGSNTAWCHPVIWQRIERTRKRRGTKLVVIDPRRTETAEQADLHVPVAPDGDIALLNALLAELRTRGLVDDAYIARHVETPEKFWETVGACDSGVPDDIFAALVDLVAAHPRMVTLFSQGANQSTCGTDKGNAIINLHLATGRINRIGAGPFSITGQPNAMGGREVGGLATMLSCHLGFSDKEQADVAEFWHAPNLCTGPGLKAVDLFRAVHDGRVKFLWVMATNPAVSLPDAGFVREALARCPTVVVSDMFADTDTASYADIVLPALGWGEKDGTTTNSERVVSRQRALFSAPGEARADWQILCDFAARIGHGDAFAYGKPAEIFREYAAMTALSGRHGKMLDLTDKAELSDSDYAEMKPFQWGGARPMADRFPTPCGRARLVTLSPPVQADAECDPRFPLRLGTGRYRDQWHTMTRTGLSPRLSIHRREPLLEITPQDAARHGLREGGLARVNTLQGSAIFRVCFNTGQRPGEIFVPMHWTDAMSGEGRANRLTGQATDPHSGQPGFKDTPARVVPIEPEWRGFLVTRTMPQLDGLLWWSRSRISCGWLCELAGDGTIDADALLAPGDRLEAVDAEHGMRRIAIREEDGAIAALLYLTRGGELPPRDWAAQQLGQVDALASELLAGRPATPLPDCGPVVCVCHGTGENEIIAAACSGAATVETIGSATAAGTNCGSCRPVIARLLETALTSQRQAAE